MTRQELDTAMRHVLVQLATCSHAPAVTGGGASSDEHPGGRRPPGDLGPEEFARRYGSPFHACSSACRHRPPATSDSDRTGVLAAAREELRHLRGHDDRARPAGETGAEFIRRMLTETRGLAPEQVATTRFRMAARTVRHHRRDASLDPETGYETEQAAPAETDGPARAARRARAHDLVENRGYSLRDAAKMIGVSVGTVHADLAADG